jgi:hypothetical protein
MLWRDMRGRTKEEIHKELQDLDPIGSPHIEEILIGRNVDLDLLSLFSLKKMQESWEGWGGRASSSRSTMEERENRRADLQMRKKGL